MRHIYCTAWLLQKLAVFVKISFVFVKASLQNGNITGSVTWLTRSVESITDKKHWRQLFFSLYLAHPVVYADTKITVIVHNRALCHHRCKSRNETKKRVLCVQYLCVKWNYISVLIANTIRSSIITCRHSHRGATILCAPELSCHAHLELTSRKDQRDFKNVFCL